ncbi:DNA repair protein XRCC1 [Frankliniella fusca]|uniref:DNA repair protein XRCC1 n=1 Tax=Frankliniella fusca TaxID=407009 RepID=A0AAE1L8A6_9NEOP|nr:DNA repair protein XRCC1 [Frankliniella fusca]
MPELQLIEVLEVSSKDVRHPPENLTRRSTTSKWLCRKGEVNRSISATFKLSSLACIGRVHVGNSSSASVSVLVAQSGSKNFKELVPLIVFRSEANCRNGLAKNDVRMFTSTQFRDDARHEMWDMVRVVCYQPYRRPEDEQFGLSFLKIFDASPKPASVKNIEGFKESAFRSSIAMKREVSLPSSMTRAERMIAASKASSSSGETKTRTLLFSLELSSFNVGCFNFPVSTSAADDDLFKASVISLLDANANVIKAKTHSDAKSELSQKLQEMMGKKFNTNETKQFSHIFHNYVNSQHLEKFPSGILTPRKSNNRNFSSAGCRKMEDTKMSLLKPQNDSFNTFNTQTVYWAEVHHNHGMKDGPVAFMGRNGKENTPFLLEKNSLTNGDGVLEETHSPAVIPDRKICLDQTQREKFSPRDSWKNRNDIDKCDSRDCSPETWLKRKSDHSERSQSASKKRPRESVSTEENCSESVTVNRVTPSGGWLLNGSGLHKKKYSPREEKKQDSMKFPFRVSPPPPPDRPASPLPLIDDIDQPSTSSRETVAERNIRLDLERRLAERSPPERVVQRTSAGKVKGPFCTKGMNTNDSPLRRLSLCDEGEEIDSPSARRKLSFVRQNGQDGDSGDLVECPVCKCYFEGCDINKHLDACVPSPMKRADDVENDDEMACPICGLWQPKDTVAAHADECAQKRYGA